MSVSADLRETSAKLPPKTKSQQKLPVPGQQVCRIFACQYLSNATRLMRPHLFHARFVVSRSTTMCQLIRHV